MFDFFKPKKTKIQLTELELIQEIPDVNCGGCGIVAYALNKKYPETLIRTCYRSWDENLRRTHNYYLNNGLPKEGRIESCIHAVVDSDGKFYHAGGVYDPDGNRLGQPDTSFHFPPDMWLHIINFGGWNDFFHRGTGVPRIEEILGISLKEINL